VIIIFVEAGLKSAVVGDLDYHSVRQTPGGYLHLARSMLDRVGCSFGDGHLKIEDAIIGKPGGPPDLFHEPSSFRELGQVGRDEETYEPVLLLGPGCFRHGVLTCERFRGLVEIREHPKIWSSDQSHDLEEAKNVRGGSYDPEPALLAHLPDRIKKDGKAATIEIGAVGEIQQETSAVRPERLLDRLLQDGGIRMVHFPGRPEHGYAS